MRPLAIALTCVLLPVLAASQVNVTTYHNDNSRTGLNANETVLGPGNVNQSQFGRVFWVPVDGNIYAQPLYMANLNIPGTGTRNVVYVATEHDSVYAIDADVGTVLWKVSFINPAANVVTLSNGNVNCTDIVPEYGITSTPVIDAVSGTLYVMVNTKESGVYIYRLHALDLGTGAEKFGGPVQVQASVPGSGSGSAGGTIQFLPQWQHQRPGLLLSNGVISIGFGSHCDNNNYHGWVMAYDATTLQQLGVYSTTPNGIEGGIWQTGDGLAADDSGTLYLGTGNGTFDVNTGGTDYSNTYVKLQPSTLSVLDYFTPNDPNLLNITHDLDISSGGVLLLPDQPGPNPHLMVGGGKEGVLYLVNRDNLGHLATAPVEAISGQLGAVHSSPAYWNNLVFVGAANTKVKAFALSNGLLSTTPSSVTPTAFGFPGAEFSISANGTSNAILWALDSAAFATGGPAILHAYNAAKLATELWNSNQAAARDTPGPGLKFTVPTVANGKVYVGTANALSAYGSLTPDYFWISMNPTVVSVPGGSTATYTVSVNAMPGASDPINLSTVGLPAGASASFNPPSVTGSGNSTLTVTTISAIPLGNYQFLVTGSNSTRSWNTATTLAVQPPLPSPWLQQDVGSVPLIGLASYSGGSFQVTGAGADIGGAADAFHFVYQPLSGDGQVIARVSSQQGSSPWAKAGVMIRETLSAGSSQAGMFVTLGNGVLFENRACSGCATVTSTAVAAKAPYWVWIVRQGNTFTGFASSDGAHWTLVSSATINMASTVYVGLAVTAHTATTSSTASFSNVVASLPNPNFSLSVGPSLSTLGTGANTTYNVTVSGFSGFTDSVSLSVSGLPAGVSASFNPASIAGSGASILTLTSSGAAQGTSPLTISGASPTITARSPVTLMTGASLPAPWSDQDVGSVYSLGGATWDPGSATFALAASSLDIGSTADAFHYVFHPMSGDGQLIARVATQQNTNNLAKAGVMIRETLAPGSRHASMLLYPITGNAIFERRSCTGCASPVTAGPLVKAPYWVKIVRQGNTFSGYISSDDSSWSLVGSANITMSSSAYIGLVNTSHATAVNTSTLDNVQ